jgi:hypothetical protein
MILPAVSHEQHTSQTFASYFILILDDRDLGIEPYLPALGGWETSLENSVWGQARY